MTETREEMKPAGAKSTLEERSIDQDIPRHLAAPRIPGVHQSLEVKACPLTTPSVVQVVGLVYVQSSRRRLKGRRTAPTYGMKLHHHTFPVSHLFRFTLRPVSPDRRLCRTRACRTRASSVVRWDWSGEDGGSQPIMSVFMDHMLKQNA